MKEPTPVSKRTRSRKPAADTAPNASASGVSPSQASTKARATKKCPQRRKIRSALSLKAGKNGFCLKVRHPYEEVQRCPVPMCMCSFAALQTDCLVKCVADHLQAIHQTSVFSTVNLCCICKLTFRDAQLHPCLLSTSRGMDSSTAHQQSFSVPPPFPTTHWETCACLPRM